MRKHVLFQFVMILAILATGCLGRDEDAPVLESEPPSSTVSEQGANSASESPASAVDEASQPAAEDTKEDMPSHDVPLRDGAAVREFRFRDNSSLAYLQSTGGVMLSGAEAPFVGGQDDTGAHLSLYDFVLDQLLAELPVDPSARYLFKVDADTWRVTTDAAVETYGYDGENFVLLESTPVTAKIPPGVEVYDQAPRTITPDGKHWIYEIDGKQKVYLSNEDGTDHEVLIDCHDLVGYGGAWWFDFYGNYMAYYITGSPVVEGEAVGVIHIPTRRNVVVDSATSVAFLEGERAVFWSTRDDSKYKSYLCDLTTMELEDINDCVIGAKADGHTYYSPSSTKMLMFWDRNYIYPAYMDLNDLGLHVPMASYDGRTALSDDGMTLVVHFREMDSGGMVTKLVPVDYPTRPHERTDLPLGKVLSERSPESYFNFHAAFLPESQQRIEEWIEAFRTGKPDRLDIMLEGLYDFSMATLECDGSAEYTITYTDESLETIIRQSPAVIKRATDYVFAAGLPTDSRYEDGQFLVLTHTPITKHINETMEYDLESSPSLGVTTPQQAVEMAALRHAQLEQYRGEHTTLVGWGWYCPPDIEVEDSSRFGMDVIGAIEVLGRPCYIVEEVLHNNVYAVYAVAADSSGLIFSISALDGGLSISADPNQEVIQAQQ